MTTLEHANNAITAVCISKNAEAWSIPEIPFYSYTDGWKPFGREMGKERVAYLAERRNKATSNALSTYPATQHILMVDSYYLQQTKEILKLVQEYGKLTLSQGPPGLILGASTWIHDKTRVLPKLRFFDLWTTPEGRFITPDYASNHGGLVPVRAVGACYVYPRSVWEKVGYGVVDDLHGCEHNWLCERSGLPVTLSLNEMLWREPVVYSWPKRVRMSLHMSR